MFRYPRANSKSSQFNAGPATPISPTSTREQPPELNSLDSLAIISDVAAASQPLLPIAATSSDPMLEDTTPGWIDTVDSQGSGSNGMENEGLRDTSPAFSTRPPSPKAPTDMVYANLFDDDRRSRTPGQTIFYLGHATHNMAYMLSHKGPPFLHTSILDAGAVRKPLPPDEVAFLRARGYYDLPPPHVQTELIRTYFAVVQPTFPVVDRVEFAKSYDSQSPPSLLLLQAMFMVAATHISFQFILDAGFKSRHEAKRTFYRRAKGLFDADYEPNRTVNIQAAFLMQFWWESPLAQKDACYWLNCAISLAQGCGMHRCTQKSGLSPSDRKLWRRIWALLVVDFEKKAFNR
jgi:Fungal specific transcription factor domain